MYNNSIFLFVLDIISTTVSIYNLCGIINSLISRKKLFRKKEKLKLLRDVFLFILSAALAVFVYCFPVRVKSSESPPMVDSSAEHTAFPHPKDILNDNDSDNTIEISQSGTVNVYIYENTSSLLLMCFFMIWISNGITITFYYPLLRWHLK